MMNITPTVKQLLIINIIFFIGSWLVPQANDILALSNIPSDQFGLWQLLTHMFMHGNIMHILFNMFALVSFGSALEHNWGGGKFLFFYISCGLGAAALQLGINYWTYLDAIKPLQEQGLSDSLLHQLLNIPLSDANGYARFNGFLDEASRLLNDTGHSGIISNINGNELVAAAATVQGQMVGASGAIYGLLVAFAFLYPNAELIFLFIPVPIKAKYFVPGLLALDLFLGFKGASIFGSGGTGIAHFAHVGGALLGYLMMWYWRKNQFNRNRWN
jgi:membrane associated rhomboid family serine protease